MEYSDEQRELGGDFIICMNCRLLGPDVPEEYVIPKGSELDKSIHDRQFPIVTNKELPDIWQEYTNQVIEYARKVRETYG